MNYIRSHPPKIIAFLLVLMIWLVACTPSPIATPPSNLISTITMTVLTPKKTQLPTMTPKPDTWKIQQCDKTLSVADKVTTKNFIWNYKGAVEGQDRIDMLLDFTNDNQIRGFVFDFAHVSEYKVDGCVIDRSFTMWLQDKDQVEAIIYGEFPSNDPLGNSSNELTIDVITGRLIEKNPPKSSSIYLTLSVGQGGTMDHRFEMEHVTDDRVILNGVKQFLGAIASDNRPLVTETLQFPMECEMQGKLKKFDTAEAFLSDYDNIFGDGFKERLVITFPNYIYAFSGNFPGIGMDVYGGGALLFNAEGKIIGIYNQKEPTPTPQTK